MLAKGWFLLTWVALCCIVMLMGDLETQAIGFLSILQFNEVFTAAETDAEMRFAWFGKGVNIRYNAEAIKPLGFALARGIQFCRSEFSSWARWKVKLSRGKQDGSRTWEWDSWKFVRFGQWPRENINRTGNSGFVGRGFPVVSRVNLNCAWLAALKVGNRNLVDANIGAQFFFGSFFRTNNQVPSSAIEKYRSCEQQRSKTNEKGVSNLETIAQEGRPELGSLITASARMFSGFGIVHYGYSSRRRWLRRSAMCIGILAGWWGIFGPLLGFDP